MVLNNFCRVEGSRHLGQGHASRRNKESKVYGSPSISTVMSGFLISMLVLTSGPRDRRG